MSELLKSHLNDDGRFQLSRQKLVGARALHWESYFYLLQKHHNLVNVLK